MAGVFTVIHSGEVLLILSLAGFFPFSINVFAKWWSTDKVILGLCACFGPFFSHPVLVCLIHIIIDYLIGHFLPERNKVASGLEKNASGRSDCPQ